MENDTSLPLYTFRQSIFFLASKLLLVEILFSFLYLLVRIPKFLLFDYLIPVETLLQVHWFGIAYYIVIAILQVIFILFVVLQYTNEYYEIKPQLIVRKKGIISHIKETYSLRNIERITVHQGIVGRWFHFGDVELYNPSLKETNYLVGVPNPSFIAQQIEHVVARLTSLRMMPRSHDPS